MRAAHVCGQRQLDGALDKIGVRQILELAAARVGK